MASSQIENLVRSAYDFFDKKNAEIPPVTKIEGRTEHIECARGCYYCCHLEVGVNASEIMVIKSYLEQQNTRELERTKTKIRHARKKIGDKFGDDRKNMRLLCPLLNDQKECSVYEVRPLSCRQWISFDRQACREDYEHPEEKRCVPYSGTLRDMAHELQEQMQHYQVQFRAPQGSFELIRGLQIAFSTTDFERRCLSGEPVLSKAILHRQL